MPHLIYTGIFFVLPCIDAYRCVDLRTVSFDVPPQEVRPKRSISELTSYDLSISGLTSYDLNTMCTLFYKLLTMFTDLNS